MRGMSNGPCNQWLSLLAYFHHSALCTFWYMVWWWYLWGQKCKLRGIEFVSRRHSSVGTLPSWESPCLFAWEHYSGPKR